MQPPFRPLPGSIVGVSAQSGCLVPELSAAGKFLGAQLWVAGDGQHGCVPLTLASAVRGQQHADGHQVLERLDGAAFVVTQQKPALEGSAGVLSELGADTEAELRISKDGGPVGTEPEDVVAGLGASQISQAVEQQPA
jgi:hypothetical protein